MLALRDASVTSPNRASKNASAASNDSPSAALTACSMTQPGASVRLPIASNDGHPSAV